MLPLVLDQVSFVVNGRTLIDRVTAEVGAGPRTIILGPNGAGKSVLMRLCHGLLGPTSGRIVWRGESAGRQRQAMVFQRPVMLRRSALANVVYGMKLAGIAPRERELRAQDVLEAVGLSHLAERPARILSGGEQQRVALARAWALNPEVLFLDEPTANLDPGAVRDIERIIA
ncbi:MAG TPA: ATP-binding cassette domain-containing protein, partial [Burkholderiales bacterium]|nr:ATP-binding cassette domain-containing protein [Burkholderiales bacterium]